MAAKIIWLFAAAADLEEIVRYIEERSPAYAGIVATRILETIEPLANFPHMGAAIREDSTGTHRHVICYQYRIIYRAQSEAVFIVGIIHGARELPEDVLKR